MSDERIEIVRAGLAAFNAGDLEAVLAFLAPDVEVYSHPDLPNAGRFEGHDGFLRWAAEWLEAWESLRMEPTEYVPVGSRDLVVVFDQFGRGKGSGVDVQLRGLAYLYTLDDEGRASRVHLYPDKQRALEQADET